uniref:Predicted protein n=2 Tax=Hordeum vulgare subsp. vulgare TaxID=112509 RepID=F2EAG1_HORVV|nr:predicted protein [Hordeum vulgare subsp. vulgare]
MCGWSAAAEPQRRNDGWSGSTEPQRRDGGWSGTAEPQRRGNGWSGRQGRGCWALGEWISRDERREMRVAVIAGRGGGVWRQRRIFWGVVGDLHANGNNNGA